MCRDGQRSASRRGFLRTVGSVGLAGGAGGCLYLRNGGESATALELVHGWTGGDHAAAMASLIDAFESAHPETPLDERPVSDAAVPELAQRRVENGDPPGTFVTPLGDALERYGAGLRDVGQPVWNGGLRGVHLDVAQESSRAAGAFAGVPLGAHRANELFYDPSVLSAADVDPGELTSVAALLDACERVDARTDAVPFVHATRNPWTTVQLLEAVLLATAGSRAHERWRDGSDVSTSLAGVVETTRSLLEWNHPDASEWNLVSSAGRLADGEAAFLQQASWIGEDLAGEGGEFGTDWDRLPFPGTRGVFALQLDGFVVPGATPAPDAASRWLRFLGSRDGQRAVNAPRVAVPTRTDLDPAAFSPYQRTIYADLAEAGDRVPSIAHGNAVPPAARTAVEEVVDQYVLGDTDPERAASALVAAVGEQE